MLLSLYKTKHSTRKWHHRIFFHLINLSIVNSWILYKSHGKDTPFIGIIVDIARYFIRGVTDVGVDPVIIKCRLRSLRTKDAPEALRIESRNHWPVKISSEAQKYRNPGCSKQTLFMCSKCWVHLCVIGSQCFLDFYNFNLTTKINFCHNLL